VKAEYAACGVDSRKRGLLLDEGLQIMKEPVDPATLIRSTDSSMMSNNVKMHPLPGRPGGPPVLMAAAADAALQRTARLADGWLPISPTPEILFDRWQKIRQTCSEIGRAPRLCSACST
jgi:alkanesulfonate monooxygenase SsuD/methylene tetrahydromethanopterin reductase-like flavin-dependent oxidoreductase (luciferase family)